MAGIQRVVKEAKDTISVDKKNVVQLVVETTPYLLTVDADMSRIYEVISNLLGNAIKFTDEGRIVIRTGRGMRTAGNMQLPPSETPAPESTGNNA